MGGRGASYSLTGGWEKSKRTEISEKKYGYTFKNVRD